MSDKMQGGILAGSTSVSVPVILRSTTDNTEVKGKVAADISAYYWRQGGTPTALTAATDLAAINSAFSAGGWSEADTVNQPGAYRLDVDNAAFATGADWVIVSVVVTGCYVFYEKYALTTNVIATGDAFARIGAAGAGLTAVTGATLSSAYDFAKGTTAMTEAYAADTVAPTPVQILFQIWSILAHRAISSTTLTSYKLDGSTVAMTFTLDSATVPTTQTRAT